MIKRGFTHKGPLYAKNNRANIYRNSLCAKHCPNTTLHKASLYYHFTDDQMGAQKRWPMPEPELEIQLEPKPEPLALTAVFFWAKKRAYVCYAVLSWNS